MRKLCGTTPKLSWIGIFCLNTLSNMNFRRILLWFTVFQVNVRRIWIPNKLLVSTEYHKFHRHKNSSQKKGNILVRVTWTTSPKSNVRFFFLTFFLWFLVSFSSQRTKYRQICLRHLAGLIQMGCHDVEYKFALKCIHIKKCWEKNWDEQLLKTYSLIT